ncbi:MAG: hypothetical protein KDC00_03555, partial [Flavobacteriales bacterium]|nr:hypothetical protein [Flavobacteriales bacterium]
MKQTILLLLTSLIPGFASAQYTCGSALQIGLGITTAPTVAGEQVTQLCVGTQLGSNGLWYAYTATNDTSIYISTHINGYPDVDTRMHIYTGTCDALICHASDDDS